VTWTPSSAPHAGNPDYAHSAYNGVDDQPSSSSSSSNVSGEAELVTPQDLDGLRKSISNLPHLVFEDLSIAWPVVVGCSSGAILFGLVWLVLIRLLSGLMVWISLLGVAVGAGLGKLIKVYIN